MDAIYLEVSSVKLTEQTRSHLKLSTHISARHLLDAIYPEVSGMLLLPKYIVVAECMAVPGLLLGDCHT